MSLTPQMLDNIQKFKKYGCFTILIFQIIATTAYLLGFREQATGISPLTYTCDLVSGGIGPSNLFWAVLILLVLISSLFTISENTNTPAEQPMSKKKWVILVLSIPLGIAGINIVCWGSLLVGAMLCKSIMAITSLPFKYVFLPCTLISFSGIASLIFLLVKKHRPHWLE